MSIHSWVIAQTLVAAMNNADKKSIIKKLADAIDVELDKRMGSKQSEKVQLAFVERVLIPLSRQLVGDTYESKLAYHQGVAVEFQRSDQELRRLDSERQKAYLAEQTKRV